MQQPEEHKHSVSRNSLRDKYEVQKFWPDSQTLLLKVATMPLRTLPGSSELLALKDWIECIAPVDNCHGLKREDVKHSAVQIRDMNTKIKELSECLRW